MNSREVSLEINNTGKLTILPENKYIKYQRAAHKEKMNASIFKESKNESLDNSFVRFFLMFCIFLIVLVFVCAQCL